MTPSPMIGPVADSLRLNLHQHRSTRAAVWATADTQQHTNLSRPCTTLDGSWEHVAVPEVGIICGREGLPSTTPSPTTSAQMATALWLCPCTHQQQCGTLHSTIPALSLHYHQHSLTNELAQMAGSHRPALQIGTPVSGA